MLQRGDKEVANGRKFQQEPPRLLAQPHQMPHSGTHSRVEEIKIRAKDINITNKYLLI